MKLLQVLRSFLCLSSRVSALTRFEAVFFPSASSGWSRLRSEEVSLFYERRVEKWFAVGSGRGAVLKAGFGSKLLPIDNRLCLKASLEFGDSHHVPSGNLLRAGAVGQRHVESLQRTIQGREQQ
ncbi:hypothetical protein F5X97DRAFT_316302 [Nemania serpens]|nr:hypothetical protein F5X97DRAFT_316302 [Nemania serpens]